MVMEREINSLADFVAAITDLNEEVHRGLWDSDNNLLFRGQSDVNYNIEPSLARGRDSSVDITIFSEERNLIEMAKFKMPDVFHDRLQPVELLALLQHHGVPTRLMDVTENALVALYFACCSNDKKDGEVFAFVEKANDVTNYPIINGIADSYRFSHATFRGLEFFYKDVIEQPYFLEHRRMMNSIHKTDSDRVEWIKKICSKPLFIYAPVRSLRQQMQSGRYILFPNKISNEVGYDVFEAIIDPMPKDHECIAARIKISAAYKKKILSDLELFGISEATLFADDIDKVCKGIVNERKHKMA